MFIRCVLCHFISIFVIGQPINHSMDFNLISSHLLRLGLYVDDIQLGDQAVADIEPGNINISPSANPTSDMSNC